MNLADFKKTIEAYKVPDDAEISFMKYSNTDRIGVIGLIFTFDSETVRVNIKNKGYRERLKNKYSPGSTRAYPIE